LFRVSPGVAGADARPGVAEVPEFTEFAEVPEFAEFTEFAEVAEVAEVFFLDFGAREVFFRWWLRFRSSSGSSE
jgi:hypothetical protein